MKNVVNNPEEIAYTIEISP